MSGHLPRNLLFAGSLIATVALGSSCRSGRPPGGMALPFIENDYAQAVARARDANLPLFVEVWAPW